MGNAREASYQASFEALLRRNAASSKHLLSHLESQKESLQKCIRIFLFLST